MRTTLLRQLDSEADRIRLTGAVVAREGWINTIRQSLGMTLAAFGRRLGINASSARKLEIDEKHDRTTVDRLRRAANALDCDLVIMVLPRTSHGSFLKKHAVSAAARTYRTVNHNMVLEGQADYEISAEQSINDLAEELIRSGDRTIWE